MPSDLRKSVPKVPSGPLIPGRRGNPGASDWRSRSLLHPFLRAACRLRGLISAPFVAGQLPRRCRRTGIGCPRRDSPKGLELRSDMTFSSPEGGDPEAMATDFANRAATLPPASHVEFAPGSGADTEDRYG